MFRTANKFNHFSFFITFLAQYSTPKVATEQSLRQFKAVYAQLTIEIYGFPSKFSVCCSAQSPQTHDISRNERSTWTLNTHRTKKKKQEENLSAQHCRRSMAFHIQLELTFGPTDFHLSKRKSALFFSLAFGIDENIVLPTTWTSLFIFVYV